MTYPCPFCHKHQAPGQLSQDNHEKLCASCGWPHDPNENPFDVFGECKLTPIERWLGYRLMSYFDPYNRFANVRRILTAKKRKKIDSIFTFYYQRDATIVSIGFILYLIYVSHMPAKDALLTGVLAWIAALFFVFGLLWISNEIGKIIDVFRERPIASGKMSLYLSCCALGLGIEFYGATSLLTYLFDDLRISDTYYIIVLWILFFAIFWLNSKIEPTLRKIIFLPSDE